MSHGTAGVAGWQGLPPSSYSDKVAPGWRGNADPDRPYHKCKADCFDWKLLKGYDDDESRRAAIRARLPDPIKETAQNFPPMPAGTIPVEPPPVAAEGEEGAEAGEGGAPAAAAAAPTPWNEWLWFWKCMDDEFGGPKTDNKSHFLDRYYDYKRPRGTNLRTWLTEHKNRYKTGKEAGLGQNSFTRTHWMFRNGRYTEDQRRWVLLPHQGNYEKHDEICKLVMDMPEDIARQTYMVDSGDMDEWDEDVYWGARQPQEEDNSWVWELAAALAHYSQNPSGWSGMADSSSWNSNSSYSGWGDDGSSSAGQGWGDDGSAVSSVGPSASQWGSASGDDYYGGSGNQHWGEENPETTAVGQYLSQQGHAMEEDGDSETDMHLAEEFLNQRKMKRRKGGKGKGPSYPPSPSKGKGKFQPWWQQQGNAPPGKGKDGGGPSIKGSKKGGSFGGKGKFPSKGFGKGKKGKKGMLATLASLLGVGQGMILTALLSIMDGPTSPLLPLLDWSTRSLLSSHDSPFHSLEPTKTYNEYFDFDALDLQDGISDVLSSSPHNEFFDFDLLEWQERFPDFYNIFIVGREKAARRGVLIDTGAALSRHGRDWFRAIDQEVLRPCGLFPTRVPATANIGGVGGQTKGSKELVQMPAAILTYDGSKCCIYVMTIGSMELGSDCPCLLSFYILRLWKAEIFCEAPGMFVQWNGRRLWVPLEATDSGHLIMPIDNWDATSAPQMLQDSSLSFFSDEAMVTSYLEDPYHGVPLQEDPVCTSIQKLEDFLGEDSSPRMPVAAVQRSAVRESGTSSTSLVAHAVERSLQPPAVQHQRRLEIWAYMHQKDFRLLTPDGTRVEMPQPDASLPWESSSEECDCLGRHISSLPPSGWWDFWQFNAVSHEPTVRVRVDRKLKCGIPVDHSTGWDDTNSRHRDALLELQDKHNPFWVCFSLISRGVSETRGSDQIIRRELSLREIENMPFVVKVCGNQFRGDRAFSVFVPHGAQILEDEGFQQLEQWSLNGQSRLLHLCPHGLRDPETGLPVKKPIVLYGNKEMDYTCQICPGAEVHPRHRTVRGSNLTQEQALWTDGLLRCFCKDVTFHVQQLRAERRASHSDAERAKRDRRWVDDDDYHVDDADESDSGIEWDEECIHLVLSSNFPAVSCRRCVRRAKGLPATMPHTRKVGCLLRLSPFRSPSRSWRQTGKAKAALKAKAILKAKVQQKPAAKLALKAPPVVPKPGAVPPIAVKPAGPPPPKAVPAPAVAAPPPSASNVKGAAVDPKLAVPQVPKAVVVAPKLLAGAMAKAAASRVDEPVADAQLREENMNPLKDLSRREENLPKSRDLRLTKLMEEFVLDYGKDLHQPGSTRFLNVVDEHAYIGAEVVAAQHLADLKSFADPKEMYKVKLFQLVRQPTKRRLPSPALSVEDAPWRYALLLLGSGQAVPEPWSKIGGLNSISFTEAAFQRISPTWAIFIHASEMMRSLGQEQQIREIRADEEDRQLKVELEKENNPDAATRLPINLGRLTSSLNSPNATMRRKGLRSMHDGFHHASVERMERLLRRAGVDIAKEEIVAVIRQCRPCRSWSTPAPSPNTTTEGPSCANHQVESDFVFYEGSPVYHFLDRYDRWHRGHATADKSLKSVCDGFVDWIGLCGPMQESHSDQEGALKTDEAALWLSRRCIDRYLVPRDVHLGLIEAHGQVLKDIMHVLQSSAEAGGIQLEIEELVQEAVSAKNSTMEYGGFSPSQCRMGSNPTWGRAFVLEEDIEDGHPFARGFRIRILACSAANESIWRNRITRAGKSTRASVLQLAQIPPGTKVEYRSKQRENKDLPAWRGPATVVENTNPQDIVMRFQGDVKRAPLHLIRHFPDIQSFHASSSEGVYEFYFTRTEMQGFLVLLQSTSEALSPGKFCTHATLVNSNGEEFTTPEVETQGMTVLKAARSYAADALGMPFVAGVRMFHAVRKVPAVAFTEAGIALVWPHSQREDISMATVSPSRPWDAGRVFERKDWEALSGMVFFSYFPPPSLWDETNGQNTLQWYDPMDESPEEPGEEGFEEIAEAEDEALAPPQPTETQPTVLSPPSLPGVQPTPSSTSPTGFQGRLNQCSQRRRPLAMSRPRPPSPSTHSSTQTSSASLRAAGVQTPQRSSRTTGIQTPPRSSRVAGVQVRPMSAPSGSQTDLTLEPGEGGLVQHPISTASEHAGGMLGSGVAGTIGELMAGPVGGAVLGQVGDRLGSALGSRLGSRLANRIRPSPALVQSLPPSPLAKSSVSQSQTGGSSSSTSPPPLPT